MEATSACSFAPIPEPSARLIATDVRCGKPRSLFITKTNSTAPGPVLGFSGMLRNCFNVHTKEAQAYGILCVLSTRMGTDQRSALVDGSGGRTLNINTQSLLLVLYW